MQTLKNIWAFIYKYSALLIVFLITVLGAVALGRKQTKPPILQQDADNDGRNDEQQIQENLQQADSFREAAAAHVDAAVVAAQRPTVVVPSKNVRESVQRNNDVDY